MSIRTRILCDCCDGHGVFSLVSSMDPSAKLYDCEMCDGTGEAICKTCGNAACGYDDDGWPRCGHHLPAEDADRDERWAA